MIAQLNHMAQIWWQWMGGMFWQVSLLIILVTIIDMAIRRWAWPQVRYVLWGLVFLKLIIPPTWQMPTSVVSWAQPLLKKYIAVQVKTGENDSGILLSSELNFLLEDPGEASEAGSQAPWPTFVFMAWIGGVAAFAIMLIRKLSRLRKWQRMQNDPNADDSKAPEWFYELLTETAQRLKLKKIPAVVFSEDAVSPAVFGVVRPTILLPEGYLDGLSREEAEHVLIHELCHLKRGDLWVHWVCLLIQVFYWFNPLLIWTRRQMRHVCEICCDLSVADILRDKTRHYRDTLLKNARELFTETVEPSLGLLGLFEEPFRIVPRLRWLERETWGHRKSKTAAVLVTSLAMVVCVMPMAGLSQPEDQGEEFSLKTVSVSAQRIISPSEEAEAALSEAMLRIETNPEDFTAAREPLIEFMETHPLDSVPPVMYQMLGQFWYIDGNSERHIEEANRVYRMAHVSFPEDKGLLLNYCVTTYELQRFGDAAPLFEKYFNLDENHEAKYLEYAAAAYMTAGNLAEAKRVSTLLIDSQEPPEARWFDMAISLCQQTGDTENAEYYIHQAMDYYPSEDRYTRLLSNLYFQRGDSEGGLAVLEEAGLPVPSESEDASETRQSTSDSLPNEDRAYKLNEVDTPPKVLKAFPPVYPLEAKENNITGRVVVELTITRDGLPKDQWIIEAEPPDVFEDAALEAVRQYRFSPGIRNGEAVDVRVKLPVSFTMDSSKADEDTPEKSSNSAGAGAAYVLSEVDSPPRVLKAFPPLYPYMAKINEIEGKVTLRFVVDTDGKAKEPEIVETEPDESGIFEESALNAIEQYEFEPATLNGEAVACIVNLPISFTLDSPEANGDVPAGSNDDSDIGTMYYMNQVETPPLVLRAFPPRYPGEAKAGKIEGRVVLRFVVHTNGTAKEPEVVESEPVGVFEAAALEAIQEYKFKPATLNGVDVSCIVRLPVEFKLK